MEKPLGKFGNKNAFWNGRRVFITGHTGFKGAWLSLWLSELGAKVYGYSLKPLVNQNFFQIINLKNKIKENIINDIRNLTELTNSIKDAKPSVIFHLAAQPLVRQSYSNPIETYTTNIIGTLNLFEAVRKYNTVKAIINVTSDKCYEDQEKAKVSSYSETDRLGGYDPYSSSKACSELITTSYRNSFFNETGVNIASVRSGNVIGGGDWAVNRLIPDFFRSIESNKTLYIRHPQAVRPWQHVLEPLSGYLLLAEKLITEGKRFSEAWNFGPNESGNKSVSWILDMLCKKFDNAKWKIDDKIHSHETKLLKLNISKAKKKLGWMPKWSLETAIDNTVQWYKEFKKNPASIGMFSIKQIRSYETL